MRRSLKRKLWIALVVVLIAAAIAVVVYLLRRSGPRAARLLPESDAVIFINLHFMRLGHLFEHTPPVPHDPDYEKFVEATGFQFERDLDQAALAIHASGSPLNPGSGGPGSFTEQARFSDVFVGRFNGTRVADYLGKLAGTVDQYRDIKIYTIPHEGRPVRVAILGVGMVAVSNVNDPLVIRTMIDKYRAAAAPVSGPTLVHDYYHHVPIGSAAWVIARFAPLPGSNPVVGLPGGFDIAGNVLAGSVVVASARYVGSIHLRIEDFAPNEQNAKQLGQMAQTFINLFRGAESSVGGGGTDPDVKALFNSLKVEQRGDRVNLTATVPPGFITKALSGAPGLPQPAEKPPAQTPPGKPKSRAP